MMTDTETISILRAKVKDLQDRLEEKNARIDELRARIQELKESAGSREGRPTAPAAARRQVNSARAKRLR